MYRRARQGQDIIVVDEPADHNSYCELYCHSDSPKLAIVTEYTYS